MQKPQMYPPPGDRLLRFVGDRIRFALRPAQGAFPDRCRAYLRTNLGRAQQIREEIIRSYTSKLPSAGAAWRDVAMQEGPQEWSIELPLAEVGFFQAKAYLI